MQQEKKYIISDCEGLLSCYLVFKWRLMLKGFLPSIILYESCPRVDFLRLSWTICFRVLTRYPIVIYTGLLPVILCCSKSQRIRSTNSIILLRIGRLMLNLLLESYKFITWPEYFTISLLRLDLIHKIYLLESAYAHEFCIYCAEEKWGWLLSPKSFIVKKTASGQPPS